MDRDTRTRRAVVMSVLPLWMVPGFLDYLCHRRTCIERTSGTPESLTHLGMMAVAGVPLTLGLFFEIDAGVLATMFVAGAVHTAITWIDVGYAAPLREITPFEQHMHAGLEVLPFVTLAAMCNLYPDRLRTLLGLDGERPPLRLEPKREPLPAAYVAGILGGAAAFIALPFAEEFVRCVRAQRER